MPAIVPPVPSQMVWFDTQTADKEGRTVLVDLTGTSDESSDLAVRLPPNLRTRSRKMRIEVATVLRRGFHSTFTDCS